MRHFGIGLCGVCVVMLAGCTALQPHHVTIHAVSSEPSPHARPTAGGNFKAVAAVSADVAKVVLTRNCTLCIVASALRDIWQGGAGVGADAVEGNKTSAHRVAVPVPAWATPTVTVSQHPDGTIITRVEPTPK